MSVLDFNYMSQALFHPTTVKLVLPENEKPEKTMYFLHGSLSDSKNCLDNMDMQEISDRYKMAIIIPDCGNFFYIDHGLAIGNYGKFIGNELVDVTRKEFGLSNEKEDTIIAGFSMGGYGAMRNGLKYHKNFGAIMALSPVCIYETSINKLEKAKFMYFKRIFVDGVFKSTNPEDKSSENYRYLLKQNIEKGISIPQMYIGCGIEEEFKILTDEFVDYIKNQNIDYVYRLKHGEHDFTLWNILLNDALEWYMK